MSNSLQIQWKYKKLSEVALIIRGLTYKPEQVKYDGTGVPCFRTKNVQAELDDSDLVYIEESLVKSNAKYVQEGDILISSANSLELLGKCCFIENLSYKATLGGFICCARPDIKQIIPKFFYYYFASEDYQVLLRGFANKTTGIANLRIPKVEETLFPVPPLPEQQRIVATLEAVLGKIDKAVTLLQQNIYSAEKLRASALNEILSNIIGDEIRLIDACEFNPSKSEVRGLDKTVSFLPMADLQEHHKHFAPKEQRPLAEVYTGYTYFREGDVLLAKVTPCFENGKSGVARNLVNGIGFGSSEYYVLRPLEGVSADFIYYIISRKEFLLEGAEYMSGAVGLKRVTKEFISNYSITLPTYEEQKRVVAYLDELGSKTSQLTQHYQNKINELKRLKNSVLQSAFKGELVNSEKIDKGVYSELGNAIEKKAKKQAVVIAMAMNEHEALGKSLYRTKCEKSVHVTESQTLDDFGRQPLKMAAGPADFEYLVSVVEPLATSMGWWQVQIEEREIEGKLKTTHKYIKGAKYNELLNEADVELGNKYAEAKRISSLFASLKNVRLAEVRATVYAAWNNLLIKGLNTELSDIIYEARDNWTQEKLLIPIEEFKDAILWLIQNNLEPKGQGKEVIKHLE